MAALNSWTHHAVWLTARSVTLNQYGSGNVSVEVGTDTVTWAGYKLPKVSLGAATSETTDMQVDCSYVVSLVFANHPFCAALRCQLRSFGPMASWEWACQHSLSSQCHQPS